jgi:hypothetical protein
MPGPDPGVEDASVTETKEALLLGNSCSLEEMEESRKQAKEQIHKKNIRL